MATQIRPNRLEVSDRFPMLGFTVRTDGSAKRYEIAIGTSPDLFGPDGKDHRSRSNFFSTRAAGPLPIERGEAVYVLPPEVLVRFIGQQKLYYGLATFSNGVGSPEVVTMPRPASPYINVSGLTGRSLQRVRVLPSRQRAAAGYGANGSEMEWAGDAARPGTQIATPTAGKGDAGKSSAAPAEPAPIHYDDGYGPLPPAPSPQAPVPQAKSLADDSFGDEDVQHGIEGPIPDDGPASLAFARPLALSPEYPQATRFEPANSTNYSAVKGTRTINRVVIHITDGQPKIDGTISWFKNPKAKVSAHYVVGQDGEVVQMVKHDDIAWHASSANRDSIGIEHVARAPHEWDKKLGKADPGLMPTEKQYCSSAALVNWLCNQFNLPMDRVHVLGHSEADTHTTHTDCPNAVWDWDYYMSLVTSGSCAPDTATASSLSLASSARDKTSALRSSYSTPRTTALRQVDPIYAPSNTQDALQYMKQFQDRKQAWKAGVPETTFFPHSAICRLRIFQTDGEYIGTGFYIANDRILTCAHNLANATDVTIIPGKNDAAEPFGAFPARPSDWVIHPKYSEGGSGDFDLAVIKVSIPPPNGQAFTILEELLQCQESPIIVCGYAADTVNPDKQHLDGDEIRLLSDSGERFEYNLQTEPGNSGSPVYYVTTYDDEIRQQCVMETRLVGVHIASVVGSKIFNEGCRLTADKIAWIKSVGQPLSAGARAYSLGQRTSIRVRAMDADLQPAQLPTAQRLTGWEKTVARAALDAALAVPATSALPLLVRLVNEQGFSVGIGLGGDAGLLGGAGLGFGIILAPNNDIGVFGNVEIRAGLLAGLSADARVIIVHGGIEAFNETGYVMGVTLEPEVLGVGVPGEVTAIALFDSQRQFHGVSFRLGIGEALSPIQIFTGVEKSVSTAVTQALAQAAAASSSTSSARVYAQTATSTTTGIGVADATTQKLLSCIQGLTDQGRGITFVQRYLRSLSSNEAAALSNAGFQIVSCYEESSATSSPTKMSYFTQAQGQHDGRRAFTQAHDVGQPAGTPIYFAVDTDPDARQRQVILDYVQGLQEGCDQYIADMQAQNQDPVVYNIGIYGSGCVLDWCQTQGIATWFWQAFAPGWCNNRQVWTGANIHTYHLDTPARCGLRLDYLEGWGNEGGWTYAPAVQSQAFSLRLPPPPTRRQYAQGQALNGNSRQIGNTAITSITGGEGNITWELDQFSGFKTAPNAAAAPLQSAETIRLTNWPYCEYANGTRTSAWFTVDWRFSGQSLGNVRITPAATQQGPYPLRVEARIEDAKDKDGSTVSLVVRFTYRFSTNDASGVVAVTELTLFSDGTIEQKSNWAARAAA